MMDSGGGGLGNASNGGGDGDQNALLESGGHHPHPFEQSRGNRNHQNHLPISTNIIIKKTIPYFIALVLACFVLYQSSDHVQYYFPISYNPLSRQSQNSTTQSCQSSSTSDQGKFSGPTNLSPVLSNSSAAPAPEKSPTNVSQPTHPQENVPNSSPAANEETEEAKLEKVLNGAAMEKKTVIVTTVNAAWTEPNSLFDLLLESFKIGNGTQKFLNHLVVIALDQKSYNRCSELHPYCYALKTEGIDFSAHEAFFMRPDYVQLVWRKIEFMYTIIKLGYNSIFTDADIMWFRDPFLHFLEDADMQTASDHYGGTPTSNDGISNTGFYYLKSNSRTIQFYEFWLASRHKFPRKHDQQVFNMIRFDPLIEKIGMKIRLLDTAFFGGFCEQSKDLNLVCTMHANCCLGLGNKLHDLRMLINDWKKYIALSRDERVKTPQTWTLPRKCH